jgi:hypothetical protein
MTLTTNQLTQVQVIIAQEVQAQTMLLKATLTRVHLQVGHQVTRTALQAMIEVRLTILLRVEILVLQVAALARILAVLVLAQEEAVLDLVQVALQEVRDNLKYKLNFIPR